MKQVKPAHKILLDKWSQKNIQLKENLIDKHGQSIDWVKTNGKALAVGSLGSLLMFASSPQSLPIRTHVQAQQLSANSIDNTQFLISDLSSLLPKDVSPLTSDQETQISEILSRDYGINVSAQIDGKRLDRSYGLIGAEQHLARFPGDNIDTHFDSASDSTKFSSSGMAPGLGAWGYFATSEADMTPQDALREEYYIAVPTFLSADFVSRVAQYRDFYKYRKMLVVNPNNGRAVVVDIADSGPAPFTGKNLGGSPEVMNYLERVDGAQKGPVLYFFVDDPNNQIPLGPINIVQ